MSEEKQEKKQPQYVIGTTLHFTSDEIIDKDFVVYLYNEQVKCWNECCEESYKYLSMLEALALDIEGEKIISLNKELEKLGAEMEAIQNYREKIGPRIGKKTIFGEIKIGDETYQNFRKMETLLKKLKTLYNIKERNKYKISHGIVKKEHPHLDFYNFMKERINEQRPKYDLQSETFEYILDISFKNTLEKYLFKKGNYGKPRIKKTIDDVYPHSSFDTLLKVRRYRKKDKVSFNTIIQRLTKDTDFLTIDIKNKLNGPEYRKVKLKMPYNLWNAPQENPLVSMILLKIEKKAFHRPRYIYYFTVDEALPKIESEEKNDFILFADAFVEDKMIGFATAYVNGERQNLFIPGGTRKALDNKRGKRYRPKLDTDSINYLTHLKSKISILCNELTKEILPLIKRYHNLYDENHPTIVDFIEDPDRFLIVKLYEFFFSLPAPNGLEDNIKELLDKWYKKFCVLKAEAVGFEKNLTNKRKDYFKNIANEIASTARTVRIPAAGVISDLQQRDTVSLPKEVNIQFRKIKKYAGSGYFFTYLRAACERAGIEVTEHGYSSIHQFEKDLAY